MIFLHAVILGIVEGVTEFLPISSTAHLEFTSHLLGIVPSDFIKSFIITIQLGAILSVIIFYREKLTHSAQAWKNICIGFIPTGIIGFILYKLIKEFLLGNVWIAATMLIVGGVIILVVEKRFMERSFANKDIQSIEDLSVPQMIQLGVIQAIAVVPGVSRSGALIIGGMGIRIPRPVIIETAFLLAIPTMIAATGYDLLKTGITFSGNEWALMIVGSLVSLVTGYLTMRWLIAFVARSDFKWFGWYRIVVGTLLLVFFFVTK